MTLPCDERGKKNQLKFRVGKRSLKIDTAKKAICVGTHVDMLIKTNNRCEKTLQFLVSDSITSSQNYQPS